MPLSVGFAGLCVLALCTALSIGQDLQHLSNENVGDTVEYNIRGFGTQHKRAISLAVKGLQALNHVLRRTVPVKSRSQSVRKYVRTGGVRTALKDFFTLDPRNSKRSLYDIYDESKMGKVLTGTVGDRRVMLLFEGDRWSKGRPVLKVIDTKITNGPKVDRIVYKKFDARISDY